MGMGISAAGLSFQPRNEIGAVKNKLQDLKATLSQTELNPKLMTKVDSMVSDLKSFLDLKSPTVKDFGEITRKLADLMDHIAEVDESFIRDFVEDGAAIDRKRSKDRMVTEYLQDRVNQISPAVAALAANATLTTVAQTSSSESFDLGSNPSGPEWTIDEQGVKDLELGDVLSKAQENTELRPGRTYGRGHQSFPPFTEDDAKAAGINMEGVHEGRLGDMAALAAFAKSRRAEASESSGDGVKKVYHYSASTAAAGSLLQMAKGFSTEELKEMIKGILKRGVKDLSDVTDLMKLVGELGLEAPQGLMDAIEDALVAFIEEEARNATDLGQFLDFVKSIQALTSDFGGNLFSQDIGDSLSKAEPSKDNLDAAQELSAFGIKVELQPNESDPADPLAAVDSIMQGQKNVQFVSGDTRVAEAAAGAMGAAVDSKKLAQFGTVALTDVNLEFDTSLNPLQGINPSSSASDLNLGTDTKKENSKLLELVTEIADKKKVEFANNIVDMLSQFMDKQLATHLDQLL